MKKENPELVKKLVRNAITLIITGIICYILLNVDKVLFQPYCSDAGMCYSYDGIFLKLYEDYDESEDTYLDILWYTCVYTPIFNNCTEKILTLTDKRMDVLEFGRPGIFIETYHNMETYLGEKEDINLAGKAYTNKKLDLYFVSEHDVIVSGDNKSQEMCMYFIDAYEMDKFTSVRYECPNKDYDKEDTYNTYTYVIKSEKIKGFNKTTKEKLKRINFSYYDENYNYKLDNVPQIEGHYRAEETTSDPNGEDMWINSKEIRIKTKNYDTTEPYTISEYNDKFILYYIKGYGGRYYYNFEKQTICSYSTCFTKVED